MKHEAWADEAARIADISLSPQQMDQLARYADLLTRIAVPRGMISSSDANRLWERHILDGLRGAAELANASSVVDVGSGAGVPGVPLTVALPSARFVLLEPRTARAAFLEAVADALSLANVAIVRKRVEEAAGLFDAGVARAFASPFETWTALQHLLRPGGRVIYWAGQSFDGSVLAQAGVPFRLSTHSDLARTGPLVIMGPQ